MKKSVGLSLLIASCAMAEPFYVDTEGRVFTTPAEDRTLLESKEKSVSSILENLELSGVHYFGLTTTNNTNDIQNIANDKKSSTGFELRRNYVQVKKKLNGEDYIRVTLDATKELASKDGYADIFIKYAYIYLDEIFPFTGLEIGVAHRPWVDYEEHHGWFYRSINKVAIEEKSGATQSGVGLVDSADLGINFQTKTNYISSEIGIFNGEGYHSDTNQKENSGLSFEYRLSVHLFGDGLKNPKPLKDTYANISTFGLISKKHQAGITEFDRTFYGIHAVYNQPEFLLAAQFATAKDKSKESVQNKDYKLYSLNSEIRFTPTYALIARYDNYTIDAKSSPTTSIEGEKFIIGVVYNHNNYLSFLASNKYIDEKQTLTPNKDNSKNIMMLTTQLKW